MKCVILCAGWSAVEAEVAATSSGPALPKALLKVGSKCLLDHWWDTINGKKVVSEMVIVCNSLKYKHFERWAMNKGLPVSNVINNGVTSRRSALGAASDLVAALKRIALRSKSGKSAKKKRERSLSSELLDPESAARGSASPSAASALAAAKANAAAAAAAGKSPARAVAGDPFDYVGAIDEDVLVIAGDSLFYREFDIAPVLAFHASKKGANLALCYELGRGSTDLGDRGLKGNGGDGESSSEDSSTPSYESPQARGMLRLAPGTARVDDFREKPKPGAMGSNFGLVSPLFYIFGKGAQRELFSFVAAQPPSSSPSLGLFMEHYHSGAVNVKKSWDGGAVGGAAAAGDDDDDDDEDGAIAPSRPPFFAMKLPSGFGLIGAKLGLREYLRLKKEFEDEERRSRAIASGKAAALPPIKMKAHARVGLMGNPSDGFHGKTMAMTIQNFWAEVTITRSARLVIRPHPLYDPLEFGSMSNLHSIGKREGYSGGVRLIMATVKKYFEFSTEKGIALPNKNFTIEYDTNIPRQVGLAGSSAIVTAVFKCLNAFFRLTDKDIPTEIQPSFVLSVETEELGINAGLQDRVAQIYQGVVYMDFDKDLFASLGGRGAYERVEASLVHDFPFFLAFDAQPSDSGKIHSDVRRRWLAGDEEIMEGMALLGRLTEAAKTALEEGDAAAFADLMDKNFETRLSMYGPECVGANNLKMVQIARSLGAAAKFPGSGGAILGLARAGMATLPELREAFEAEGFVFVKITCAEQSLAYGGGADETTTAAAAAAAAAVGEADTEAAPLGTEIVSVSLGL